MGCVCCRVWCADDTAVCRMENHKWKMWMRITTVYDGDTVTVLCAFNGKLVRWRARLTGFDAPEIRSKNEDEKKSAIAAKEYLKTIVPRGLFKGQCNGLDKYGRLLLDLTYKGHPISEIMIMNNHGYAYKGGKKQN